jgi:16S rRNA (adenine1518-N6/adenine1519-N6)-dimethyltransferase
VSHSFYTFAATLEIETSNSCEQKFRNKLLHWAPRRALRRARQDNFTPQPFGQHFLADANWRQRIAETVLGLGGGDGGTDTVWIEIGAGHGEMTALLAKSAARLVAIEIDSRLLPRLNKATRQFPNVTVVPGDVLKLDLPKLAAAERYSVYGNLPYYITSPIVHQLLEHASQLRAAFLVVQMEVAERLVAAPGGSERGYFSVFTQFYSQPEILLPIPPEAFDPPPKVNSALVALHLPGERVHLQIAEADEPAFLWFLKTCFAQKRKMLRNNLRAILPAAALVAAFQEAGVPAAARAEELTLAQLASLFAACRQTT